MKGLLIKDFKLLKAQRGFFTVMIFMTVGLAFSVYDTSFIIGYLCFILPMFALSTVSYDEFDNGNAFLFTLPISREGYVIEKYGFGILLGIGALILAVALSLIVGSVKGTGDFTDILLSVPYIFSAMTVFLAIMIPVQLKFGGEKSRFVMVALVGAAVALIVGIAKVLGLMGVDTRMLTDILSSLHAGILIAGAVGLALCAALLSIKVSIAILSKKEF